MWAPTSTLGPARTWPPVLISQITTAFSEPGDQVGLLAWPTAGTGAGEEQAPILDEQVDDALTVIDTLDRAAVLEHLPARSAPAITTATDQHTPAADPVPASAAHTCVPAAPELDLIITSLEPGEDDSQLGALVAEYAASRLQPGGILTVLTHSEQRAGELNDPTGAVVAAGQDVGLLYLQHLVVLHAPLSHGPVTPAVTDAASGRSGQSVRGHRRVHSDVLVFTPPTNLPTCTRSGH